MLRKPRSRKERLRIGFFGSFYPEFHRAGNSSSGLVLLLAHDPIVESIRVFGQAGASIPPVPTPSPLRVDGFWNERSPVSLLKNMLTIIVHQAEIDCLLTNTYVTAFGKRPASNLVGLLTPSIFAVLTGKPSVVYLHNSSVTQDTEKLGYAPSRWTSWILRIVERILVVTTTVIVPLESQKQRIEELVGGRVEALVIPYVDCALSAMLGAGLTEAEAGTDRSNNPTVLLIGAWGPQKDLDGVLKLLRSRVEAGRKFHVIVAGEANRNFPEYAQKLRSWKESLPPETFTFLGRVSEEKLLDVVAGSDVAILPYLASGGYSGVLSSAAMVDTPVVAYDLPQLREFSQLLNADVSFVNRTHTEELASRLEQLLSQKQGLTPRDPSRIRNRLLESRRAAGLLLSALQGRRD